MKKYLLVSLLAIVAVALCIPLLLHLRAKYENAQRLRIAMTSPDHTYQVKLEGENLPQDSLFVFPHEVTNRKVNAIIIRNSDGSSESHNVYTGDGYDSDFRELLPDSEWLSENVLHLTDFQRKGAQGDKVYVTNRSRDILPYTIIRVGKKDYFLLFDLEPGSVVKFTVPLNNYERIVGGESETTAGKEIPFQDVGFSESMREDIPLHYCVNIDDNSMLIQSEEVKGLDIRNQQVPIASRDQCAGAVPNQRAN